jgi:hypothetical protein
VAPFGGTVRFTVPLDKWVAPFVGKRKKKSGLSISHEHVFLLRKFKLELVRANTDTNADIDGITVS